MRWFAPVFALAALVFASSARADGTHVVERGQTLTWIAKKYGVTVDEIRKANGLFSWQQLKPGQELDIPGLAAKPEKASKLPRAAIEAKAHVTVKPGTQAAKGEGDYARRAKQPGVVHLVRGDERYDAQLVGRRGKVNATAVSALGKILRFYPTGARTSMDPKLAGLIANVSDHFGGRTIHVVSGFRPYSPRQYTPHSNHNVGKAMDFNIEGVPNAMLRDYCRTLPNAGVGFYPNSTFVHLDTRATKTFWIDYSRPGERPKYDGPNPHPDADESTDDVSPQGEDAHFPDSANGSNLTRDTP
ncbi:MAG TPA: DUF882 domain-containing protein [Byssovorax sp.]|jgi:uncharacterized protein YcbK (DUF882 family)